MNKYEVTVTFELTIPGDDEAAYRVVDELLDAVLTPNLPAHIDWSMTEGCVTSI